MTRSGRSLRRRLPRNNNQRGFTLIEMLVVISILGILAAVVTMSMVGITNTAKDRAQKAELQTVQVALDTMAADKGMTTGAISCDGDAADVGTQNMKAFPSATAPLYRTVVEELGLGPETVFAAITTSARRGVGPAVRSGRAPAGRATGPARRARSPARSAAARRASAPASASPRGGWSA